MIINLLSDFFNNTLLSASAFAWEKDLRLLGIKIIDVIDFSNLLLRFLLNSTVLLLILQFIYVKFCKRRDFYFSYMAVGVTVFLLCFMLNNVKLELGFALGLFAIFGILRYRTDAIPMKEMTYLFVIIGVSVINALANKKVSYTELIFANSAIFFGLWLLENRLSLKREASMTIVYENIEDIHLENSELLLQNLKKKTGIEIIHYEIEKIDYLKDAAIIHIYFNAVKYHNQLNNHDA